MIEGIKVLSQSPIFDYDYAYGYIAIGAIVGAIAVGLLIGAFTQDLNFAILGSLFGVFMGGIVGTLITDANVVKTDTGRYQYKVLIEDGVEMKEFYERYNVIEQDGEIWIIEDKEIKND